MEELRNSPVRSRRLLRRRVAPLLSLILIAAAVLFGLKCWRLYQKASALRDDIQILQSTPIKLDKPSLAAFGLRIGKTHDDALALRAEASALLPFTHYLGWVPRYGPTLAAAEPLLNLTVDLTAVADDSFAALSPLALPNQLQQPPGVVLTKQLMEAQPQLQRARQTLGEAMQIYQTIPIATLVAPLPDYLQRGAALLPTAQDTLDLALAAPQLLGASGSRNYLIMAQNPDELRATGGFITAAGTLTVDGGRITDLSIRDSGTIGDYGQYVYPDPPAPLQQYMDMQMWLFRDSNWSPDFPTAARAGIELYNISEQRDIAGVLAFDPTAIQLLLSATGPITVEGSPERVGADNVVAWIRNGPSPVGDDQKIPWAVRRKALLGPLAQALIRRFSNSAGLDFVAIAQAVQRALAERHVSIYLKQPDAAAVLARRGWDGAVRPGPNDFLMIVDSNVGYNKVTPNVAQSVSYAVDLTNPGAPLAELSVRYTHRLSGSTKCDQIAGAELVWQIRSYEEWMTGCYWDYLRVLAPGAAQLISATADPIPADWMMSGIGDDSKTEVSGGEAGTRAFGSLLVVPVGGERQKVLRYRLPTTVLARTAQRYHYRLTVQKQAGVSMLPITVRVRLPAQSHLLAASPSPTASDLSSVTFNLNLTQDQILDVEFEMP